ncbi:floral homeotic protein DEFICIENS-like isoform X2 [Glycine soja]|uniref:floral homeotic protein DEFICIENS-like isoform X2 n=1 Tax=Glycine soja TaxID=3848 RepID=UPI001039A404|nr:floral homeotic protein DEFICIENS-like isoform X2 [Glycine soja]
MVNNAAAKIMTMKKRVFTIDGENLKKLKEVNRNLRKEIRQRMGDCMNDLGIEDLKLLEEEMDKAAKVVRECKGYQVC